MGLYLAMMPSSSAALLFRFYGVAVLRVGLRCGFLIVSLGIAIASVNADETMKNEGLLSRINLGKERSIFLHQPTLSYSGEFGYSQPILRTNIYALLANPAEFAGKNVAFTGFFGSSTTCSGNCLLYVYASDIDRKGELVNNGFKISLKPDFLHQDQVKQGDVIDVVGEFVPRPQNSAMIFSTAGEIKSSSIRVLGLRRFTDPKFN